MASPQLSVDQLYRQGLAGPVGANADYLTSLAQLDLNGLNQAELDALNQGYMDVGGTGPAINGSAVGAGLSAVPSLASATPSLSTVLGGVGVAGQLGLGLLDYFDKQGLRRGQERLQNQQIASNDAAAGRHSNFLKSLANPGGTVTGDGAYAAGTYNAPTTSQSLAATKLIG